MKSQTISFKFKARISHAHLAVHSIWRTIQCGHEVLFIKTSAQWYPVTFLSNSISTPEVDVSESQKHPYIFADKFQIKTSSSESEHMVSIRLTWENLTGHFRKQAPLNLLFFAVCMQIGVRKIILFLNFSGMNSSQIMSPRMPSKSCYWSINFNSICNVQWNQHFTICNLQLTTP